MLEKQRRDVFYKYEKRIRELSTQEKVRHAICLPEGLTRSSG